MRAGKKKPKQERNQMDWNIEVDEEEAVSARPEREKVPEGTHDLKIVEVIQHSPGLEVRLAHDDKRYGWVFVKMTPGRTQDEIRLKQMCRSLAITTSAWKAMEPTDLVDRRIRAEIVHRVDAAGRMWVNVWNFMPIAELAEEAAEKAKRPARTPAAKVKAASPAIGSDDIPF
jgi:hypothetical protein